MSIDHLVEMANDIGAFFIVEKNQQRAVDGSRSHIERFWEPRMRRKLLDHWRLTGGEDFSPQVQLAVADLAQADLANAKGTSTGQ